MNPLRYTDPQGLFSVDEIVHSLGVGSFSELLTWFENRDNEYTRWGFLQLILDANYLDMFYGITLETFGRVTEIPIGFFLAMSDCKIGVYADRLYTLPEYIEQLPYVAKKMRPLDVPYWRTIVHRYRLEGGKTYRDTHHTDLPDYYSVGIGAEVAKIGFKYLIITDRYGHDYRGISLGYGTGISLSFWEYEEGYIRGLVAEWGTNIPVPMSEEVLRDAIQGPSIGVSFGIFLDSSEGAINVQIPPYLEGSYSQQLFDFLSVGISADLWVWEVIDDPRTEGWVHLDNIPYDNKLSIIHSTSSQR